MHPQLNTMPATHKIADLHPDAAQARLVHETRKAQATTRRAGWTARVAAYLL